VVGIGEVVAAAVVAVVAVAEVAPQPEQMLELEQRVGLVVRRCPLVLLQLVFPHFDFASLLVGDAVSRLAFVFASHGFDEWLLVQDHIPGNERLYIDDSDSEHIVNSHNEAQDIFGPYTLQCASIIVSCPHSVV